MRGRISVAALLVGVAAGCGGRAGVQFDPKEPPLDAKAVAVARAYAQALFVDHDCARAHRLQESWLDGGPVRCHAGLAPGSFSGVRLSHCGSSPMPNVPHLPPSCVSVRYRTFECDRGAVDTISARVFLFFAREGGNWRVDGFSQPSITTGPGSGHC